MPGQTEGRTEGLKNRQTPFYRTLPATAGGPKIQVMAIKHLNNYNATAKIIQ